jgi:predicted membrane protein
MIFPGISPVEFFALFHLPLTLISSPFFILVIVNSLKSAEAHQAIIFMLESLQSLKLFSYYL